MRDWLRARTADSGSAQVRDYLPVGDRADWLSGSVVAPAGDAIPSVSAAALLVAARDAAGRDRDAVVEVLGAAGVRWWLQADVLLRRQWWNAPRWSLRIARLVADGDADLLGLLVAACHHSGWVREAAVAGMAGRVHPAAVTVLAVRTTDWVQQVRDRARVVVEPLLAGGDAGTLVRLAQVGYAVRQRRGGTWLADKLDARLADLSAAALRPLLAASDRPTRRAAYRAGIGTGALGVNELVAAARKDDDQPIRVMCAQAAVRSADPDALRALLSSRTAVVRAEALYALVHRGEVDAAVAALADRHPAVRGVAQAALRRAGTDPADHYRRLTTNGWPEPGAIAGLGETGRPGDAETLIGCLGHPRPRGRLEAVRALRRLGVTPREKLLALLRDPSPAVTRQVVATLRRDAAGIDAAVTGDLLRPDQPPHVRFAGYRLATWAGGWRRLSANLDLVDDADQRLRDTARSDIGTWLAREAATTYQPPDPRLAAELSRQIRAAEPALGAGTARLLRFHAALDIGA